MNTYRHAAIGGTFDHLHAGHLKLIDKAFAVAHKVSIGITTDEFAKNKLLYQSLQSFKERKKVVVNYIKNKDVFDRVTIMAIHDIYGSAATDPSLDAIVVSRETRGNAKKINLLRRSSYLPQMAILAVNMKKSDDRKVLRSSRIRMGEVDREGKVFSELFRSKSKLILPQRLRKTLQQPLGRIVTSMRDVDKLIQAQKSHLVIAVGDVVTSALLKNNIVPSVSIIDYRVNRIPQIMPELASFKNLPSVKNNPGIIEVSVAKKILRTIRAYVKTNHSQTIIIDGEEDLLALPAILFAPLGSLVLYGQPKEGMVCITVTEIVKEDIFKLLQKFT